MLKHNCCLFLLLLVSLTVFSQQPDTSMVRSLEPKQAYDLTFKKPRLFSFITDIPRDVVGFTKQSFKRNNITNLSVIVGASAILYLADQSITNTLQDKSEDNNIQAKEDFKPLLSIKLGGKKTNIGKIPRNFNTAMYDLGQGSSAMLMATGFYILGKIKNDNRALQTAKQLTQAFITLGVGTQLMKFATGRENPSDATKRRGRWRPFPGWSNFQNNKTRYDAYPSGHLATFVSAVTIISENYPRKKWIKPVGYAVATLCSLAMINNGVHWASDFPLGFALGYGYGRYISRKSHIHTIPAF
jgi:hypothetical protein